MCPIEPPTWPWCPGRICAHSGAGTQKKDTSKGASQEGRHLRRRSVKLILIFCTAAAVTAVWRVQQQPSEILEISPQTLSTGPASVDLTTSKAIAALQFDLVYDPRALDIEVRPSAALQVAAKELSISNPAPGAVRVLISGANQNPLRTGVVATLSISARVAAESGAHSVSLFNSVAADPAGGSVPLETRAGTFHVSQK